MVKPKDSRAVKRFIKIGFRALIAGLFLSIAFQTVACTQDEAFGFKFGQPVPNDTKDVTEFYFMGGSGTGNVLRSFLAPVPMPIENFQNYTYWANRDRKIVNSIIAYRQIISDKILLNNDAYRASVLENTKLEISQLRDAWEQKYGISYKKRTPSELTWDGENAYVSSTIGTFGGEYLYIECTNKGLRREAESIAVKAWLKQ